MTLIAAYKEHNTPILLGDVLITRGSIESHCRKINKISPNFVIGWTGYKINAMAVLKDLYKRFAGKKVSMSEVEKFLVEYDTSSFYSKENEIKLIMSGWIVDEDEHCFVWNSGYNELGIKEVVYDTERTGFFNGSGDKFFQSLLNEKVLHTGSSPGMSEYSKARMRALSETCALTNGEYLAVDRSWRRGFGFAYEVLIYNGREFEYLDDLLFFALDMLIDESNKLKSWAVVPLFYKYKNFGNISLFQISKIKEKQTHLFYVGSGIESVQQIEHLVTLRGGAKPLPPQSRYYCITARLYKPDRSKGGTILLEQGSEYIKVSDNNISFYIPFLQDIINKVFA